MNSAEACMHAAQGDPHAPRRRQPGKHSLLRWCSLMTSRSNGVLSGMTSFRGVNDILEFTAIITAMDPTCTSTFFDATSKNKIEGSMGRKFVWSEVAGRAIFCIAIHGSVWKVTILWNTFSSQWSIISILRGSSWI